MLKPILGIPYIISGDYHLAINLLRIGSLLPTFSISYALADTMCKLTVVSRLQLSDALRHLLRIR